MICLACDFRSTRRQNCVWPGAIHCQTRPVQLNIVNRFIDPSATGDRAGSPYDSISHGTVFVRLIDIFSRTDG